MKYPSVDLTGAPSIMPSEKPSSKLSNHPSSDPDVLKRGIQEAPVSLQKCIIRFILHIILSLSSRKRATQAHQQEILRIYHIGVHKEYYETRFLFSITNSKIYNKEKCEQVKVLIFYKSTTNFNTFLFDPPVTEIGHSQVG